MTPTSNTGQSRVPGGFVKGDPRIWRKGRPKSFDALRRLAQQIAHETVTKEGQPLIIEGHVATVSEMILRQWAHSKEPQLQKAFMEICYGKVPDRQELTGPDGRPLDMHRDIVVVWGDQAKREADAARDPTRPAPVAD